MQAPSEPTFTGSKLNTTANVPTMRADSANPDAVKDTMSANPAPNPPLGLAPESVVEQTEAPSASAATPSRGSELKTTAVDNSAMTDSLMDLTASSGSKPLADSLRTAHSLSSSFKGSS
jgi:hypothetical protein